MAIVNETNFAIFFGMICLPKKILFSDIFGYVQILKIVLFIIRIGIYLHTFLFKYLNTELDIK